jgi:hypothetical protein
MSRYTATYRQGDWSFTASTRRSGTSSTCTPADDSEEPVEQHSWFTGMTGAKMMDEFGKRGVKVPEETLARRGRG